MATINFATREITAKIVYFGAAGAGCNTNVERLYATVAARTKGQLHKFGPRENDERSWYFDFRPAADGPLEGFAMRWQIYSLPGAIDLVAHREEVMGGVDAVVFVADARAEKIPLNVDALLGLEGLLGSIGLELAAMPIVIQVNHCDQESARPAADVTFDLNPYGFPVVEAVASAGKGVSETHLEVTAAVVARVADALAGNEAAVTLTAVHDAEQPLDAEVIRRHVQAIQERSQVTPQVDEVTSTSELPDDLTVDRIEIGFQPRDFAGSHPTQVLGASIEGDKVWVDLVMERMGGGEPRRLSVVLANRPTDTPPVPRNSPASPVVQGAEPVATDRVFDYLPEPDEVRDTEEQAPADLPGVLYGLFGVAGGVLIGLLSGYLLGFAV